MSADIKTSYGAPAIICAVCLPDELITRSTSLPVAASKSAATFSMANCVLAAEAMISLSFGLEQPNNRIANNVCVRIRYEILCLIASGCFFKCLQIYNCQSSIQRKFITYEIEIFL